MFTVMYTNITIGYEGTNDFNQFDTQFVAVSETSRKPPGIL
jgi:hypothetical protein